METKLKTGTTLIVDRYSYSGVAFSAAKGLDIEWCKVKVIAVLFFLLAKKKWYNMRTSLEVFHSSKFRVSVMSHVLSLYISKQ